MKIAPTVLINGEKWDLKKSDPCLLNKETARLEGVLSVLGISMRQIISNSTNGACKLEEYVDDLAKEYKLVLEKKSKLSSTQRRCVESRFKRLYEKSKN